MHAICVGFRVMSNARHQPGVDVATKKTHSARVRGRVRGFIAIASRT
jgi:hypothetical protein